MDDMASRKRTPTGGSASCRKVTRTFSTTMRTTARPTPFENSGSISSSPPSKRLPSQRLHPDVGDGLGRVDEVGGGDVAGLVEGDRDRPARQAGPRRHRQLF